MISGWKLDWTPAGFLKFGLGHMMMFGGKGVKRPGFSHFVASSSLVFSGGGGDTETENHIMSWDFQLFLKRLDRFLPLTTGAKIYGEWGAEDESKSIPVDLARVAGVYFTDVFKVPGFDFKAEFARFHKVFYTHFKYISGYTHRGNFIGHHAGGDSEDIALSAIFNFPGEYRATATFSHMRTGLTKAYIESTNQLRVEFGLTNALNMYNIKDVEVTLFYELDDITNFENTSSTAKNHLIGAEVSRKF